MTDEITITFRGKPLAELSAAEEAEYNSALKAAVRACGAGTMGTPVGTPEGAAMGFSLKTGRPAVDFGGEAWMGVPIVKYFGFPIEELDIEDAVEIDAALQEAIESCLARLKEELGY